MDIQGMTIVGWILFGLVAGIVAKILLPGKERIGWIGTVLVGIGGSFLGGFLGRHFDIGGGPAGWNTTGFVTAVAGALILLIINRVVTRS